MDGARGDLCACSSPGWLLLALSDGCLFSQGEWLLLFNYLLPFPEVLQQAAQLPAPSKGLRITANTEAVSATSQSTHKCSESPTPGQGPASTGWVLRGIPGEMANTALLTLHGVAPGWPEPLY